MFSQILRKTGDRFMENGRFEEAEICFLNSIQTGIECLISYIHLANCCFRKVLKNKSLNNDADLKKTKLFYKIIINLKKDYSYVYKKLGMVYCYRKSYRKALDCFLKAVINNKSKILENSIFKIFDWLIDNLIYLRIT